MVIFIRLQIIKSYTSIWITDDERFCVLQLLIKFILEQKSKRWHEQQEKWSARNTKKESVEPIHLNKPLHYGLVGDIFLSPFVS